MSIPSDAQILLKAALSSDKNEILQLLQEKKIDFNDTTNIGLSILERFFYNDILVEKDIVELFETFLDQGFDPNTENRSGTTVMYTAVQSKTKNVVELLIKRNARIDKSDECGKSIAHRFIIKIDKEFFNIVKFECSKTYRSVDESIREIQKAERDNVDYVKWLISKGFDFNRKNNIDKSALHLCIEHYLQHILLILLKDSANTDMTYQQDKTTLLHLFLDTNAKGRNWWSGNEHESKWYTDYASRYAFDIVKLLLDMGISSLTYNSDFWTPLYIAISKEEDQCIIEMLINQVLEENDHTTTLFLELSKSCRWWADSKQDYYFNLLQILAVREADINVKHKTGTTPLYFAVQAKNLRAVEFLNERGADFKAITNNGENLFHALAEQTRHNKLTTDIILETLFIFILNKSSNDLNAKNRVGDTPLHFASSGNNFKIAENLIKFGVEINCKNNQKLTPLHLAAKNYDKTSNLVLLLLENGADVNAKDINNRRPLHYAARSLLVTPMLLSWGAYVNAYADGKSPFCTAVEYMTVASNARTMLRYGADINDEHIINVIERSELDDLPIRAVLRHWIKLKVAGLPCLEKYETFITDDEELQELGEDCLREIATLKATFVDNRTSIYAWLHMDFDSQRSYINNRELENLVNANLKQQFPKYHVLILARYRESIMWKKLLQPAKIAWLQLTEIALPDICIERIFAYVRVVDLVNLSEHGEDNNLLK